MLRKVVLAHTSVREKSSSVQQSSRSTTTIFDDRGPRGRDITVVQYSDQSAVDASCRDTDFGVGATSKPGHSVTSRSSSWISASSALISASISSSGRGGTYL